MENTRISTMLATTAALALAACGGGSSAVSNNPTTTFNVERVFSDNAGVARAVSSNGVQGYVIMPDVGLLVQTSNEVSAEDLTSIQVSDFPIFQVLNSNAYLRQGAITVDGVVINVTAVEDLGGFAEAAFMEVPGYLNALIVAGTQPTNLPSGTFQYQGTMGTALRYVNDPQPQLGDFTLIANFSTATFNVNGSTLSDTLTGSGVINNLNGTINANNLFITTSGTLRSATMYGQFHGNAASSVSGVFHSNEADPFYAGFIVGSR